MLMISRNVGESIRVGHQTVITVVSISGRQARLGIDAPREISIVREEQHEKAACSNVSRAKLSLRGNT